MSNEPTLSDFTVVQIPPSQYPLTNINSFIEWGSGLTLQQYLERESLLANLAFSIENLTTWALVPRKNPETTTFFCSCETYRRSALIRTVDKNGEVEVKEGVGFSIASVFCVPSHRKKGYASLMLKLLSQKLREMGAVFSSLYSDIGKDFYTRLGWKLYPYVELRLDVFENADGNFKEAIESQEFIAQPVIQEEISSITHSDCDLLLKEFQRSHRNGNNVMNNNNNLDGSFSDRKSSMKCIVILPTPSSYEWMLERSKFYARVFGISEPRIWGAQITLDSGFVSSCNNDKTPCKITDNHSSTSINLPCSKRPESFILWIYDFLKKDLRILRFRSENKVTTRLLIDRAKREAALYGLERVIIWNPDLKVFDENIGRIMAEMKISLPSLAWYDDHGNFGDQAEDIEWLHNEYYAW
ncbi:hypothetical protein G9A89_015027 [Geosiphon pyriformis]|nr:hypothetical protein G9A89_015027 [Geosiphon pyriformis]